MGITEVENCYNLRSRKIFKTSSDVDNAVNPKKQRGDYLKQKKMQMRAPPRRQPDPGSQSRRCAETALKHYNDVSTTGVTYRLVDEGKSAAFTDRSRGGHFFHCNFKAKPFNSSAAAGTEEDPDTMLFFAEICRSYPNPNEPSVRCCIILGPAGRVSLGLNGCKACYTLHHPPAGFVRGTPQNILS